LAFAIFAKNEQIFLSNFEIMKTINILLFFTVTLIFSCKKKTAIDTLPKASQEGRNTMGYLYDGKPVVVEGKYEQPILGCHSGWSFEYYFIQGRKCGFPTIHLGVPATSFGVGTIYYNKTPILTGDPYGELDLLIAGETYQTNDSVVGKILITKASDSILSGTFDFECINIFNKTKRIKVTDGRFDLSLKK
jgi:hypothetical protein